MVVDLKSDHRMTHKTLIISSRTPQKSPRPSRNSKIRWLGLGIFQQHTEYPAEGSNAPLTEPTAAWPQTGGAEEEGQPCCFETPSWEDRAEKNKRGVRNRLHFGIKVTDVFDLSLLQRCLSFWAAGTALLLTASHRIKLSFYRWTTGALNLALAVMLAPNKWNR